MPDLGREERRGVLSARSDRHPSAFAHESGTADFVSLLYNSTPEEWRRTWRTELGSTPQRELVCNVAAVARGATASSAGGGTASTQVLPDRNLALRTFERPVDASKFVDVVTASLGDRGSGEVVVYLDALAELASDSGLADTVAALERLRDALPPAGIVVCRIDGDAVDHGSFERFAELADDVVGERPEIGITEAVDRLRRVDPTNFGYARRHWREAGRAIDRSGRSYPKAKQLHGHLTDPETTPRTLGATLKALVDLGVIDVWSETVGPTRYDLTAYDAERLHEAGKELDASD